MSLELQFQGVLLAFLFGFIFAFFLCFFNYFLFKLKIKILIFFFECFIFLLGTLVYFLLNVKINQGHVFIYIPLFIASGVFVFFKFLYKYIKTVLDKFYTFLKKSIFNPIKFEIKKKYDIIKAYLDKGEERHAKKFSRKSESMESKQSGQHYYDWSFFDCVDDHR